MRCVDAEMPTSTVTKGVRMHPVGFRQAESVRQRSAVDSVLYDPWLAWLLCMPDKHVHGRNGVERLWDALVPCFDS